MSGKRFVLLLLLIAGGIVSAIYLAGKGVDLSDTIRPRDYLAKLNDNDTYGCKNSIRVHPDILVLGDSHSYTGLDFNLIAEEFGTEKIAACTLGSMFIESVLYALQQYESLGALPKTVIYATSTRAFWEERNKKEMLFSHKAQISAVNQGDLLFSVQNVFAYLFGRDSSAYRDARRRLEVNTPLVEAMNEENIARVLARSAGDAPSLANWRKRIAEAEFTPDAEDLIRQVGELVRRHGITLFVVAVPESPWLEKEYPAWIRERYYGLLRAFKPYARGVFIYTAADAGLGNRHFINRSLKSGYDYSKWDAPEFHGRVDFNADHMGGVGALRFTAVAAKDMVRALAVKP